MKTVRKSGVQNPSKHLNLVQLNEIKENQYRSRHCGVDYSPEEIEARLIEKMELNAEKILKRVEKAAKNTASKPKGKKRIDPNVKADCSKCSMIIRTSRKWIIQSGLPSCACGGYFQCVDKTDEIPF